MKSIVLDATEVRKDWRQTGLSAQLLGHASDRQFHRVFVPPSVVEEVIAHHERARTEQAEKHDRLRSAWARLGQAPLEDLPAAIDYRSYLMGRFDDVLSFEILDWPLVSHRELVARAVERVPPFDAKGSGYRDCLVWSNVVDLVREGHDVALVSADGIFRGPDGMLSPHLLRDVEGLSGKVELVTELVPWLLDNLPWWPGNLRDAVSKARDESFFSYFLHSDIQDELAPEAADIGFDRSPFKFEVESVEWDYEFVPVGTRSGPEGIHVSEYDVDEVATFIADLPSTSRLEDGWTILESVFPDVVTVQGQVKLTVRLAVFFDDELNFSVEQLSWRRRDGSPAGSGLAEPDPTSIRLFE